MTSFTPRWAPHDDARLRKILWTVCWRGNAQLRERVEDELCPQDQPKVEPEKELPDPAGVLAALAAGDPAPARQAVAKIVDLACDMKGYDYFHSDDPVAAARFVVPEAVAALREWVLRHGGFAAFAGCVPKQLIRWEQEFGWTRRGYGQVAERETPLAFRLPGC